MCSQMPPKVELTGKLFEIEGIFHKMGSDFTEIMAIGKLVLKDLLLPCGIGRGDGFCC